MLFVDNLGIEMFVLAFVGFLMAYAATTIMIAFRSRREDEVKERLSSVSVPTGIVGLFVLIMAIAGELLWPIPAFHGRGYDILFFDAFSMLGVLLLSVSFAIHLHRRLEYVGLLAFMFGITVVFYGISAYNLGMTREPLAMLGMYCIFGISGILALPATMAMDRALRSQQMGKQWFLWSYAFVAFMVLAAIEAIVMAGPAIAAHLASAP